MDLREILSRFPDFKAWAEARRLSSGELDILTEFPPESFSRQPAPAKKQEGPADVLGWIARRQPSHSHGAGILDLACELLLMGRPVRPLLQKENSPKALLAGLRALRQPEASLRERQKEESLKKLPWPRGMSGRLIRAGDQCGLEIRFQSFSLKGFRQKIKSLDSIGRLMAEGGLWEEAGSGDEDSQAGRP